MTTAPPATAARNYWSDAKCAKAFWSQHELPAFQTLVADTVEWAAPAPGEAWLDLGCGGGTLTRGLWEASRGEVGSVVGVDCAAANDRRYHTLRLELVPPPGGKVEFVCHDFSAGLAPWVDGAFDHAVSGLSISYAESFDEATGAWTQDAYDRLLAEVCRVLKPGGRFVFSVNVPEPSWWVVGAKSMAAVFRTRRPLKFLKNSLRMMKYGAWLKEEARRGRFHYLAPDVVEAKLVAAGFARVEHRLSYAGQALVFRAAKS